MNGIEEITKHKLTITWFYYKLNKQGINHEDAQRVLGINKRLHKEIITNMTRYLSKIAYT